MAEKSASETALVEESSQGSFSLRETIRKSREFLTNTITTARVHSPLADDKLEAADNAVSAVIHTGYQAVKGVIVNGHPGLILTVAGIAAAAPSIPFGPRAIVRNAGLSMALAAVMIYPDHLKTQSIGTSETSDSSKDSS